MDLLFVGIIHQLGMFIACPSKSAPRLTISTIRAADIAAGMFLLGPVVASGY